jgi:imidazolonepropionase-like amidohydrolase/ABC-type multidrug transport system permease subunit
MKPYIAQINSNLRLMGRDRSVLFFSYLFPLVFFFLFGQLFDARQSPAAMQQVIAMVLIISVLGNGFFGAGMRTVQDRETNVLRRFKVAPISAAPILVASLVSGLVAFLPVVILFLLFGRILYRAPLPHNLLSLFIFVSVGVLAFRSLGMVVAAVVNSAQEGGILIQILYLPMLFLSGATFPASIMPVWVQQIAQFLPSTYLFQGMQAIMINGESAWKNLGSVVGLVITLCVALFIGVKLFRWEKEEKIAGTAKLWIVAVLAPFFLMGAYQVYSKQNIKRAKILSRNVMRNRSVLFQNARIFVGNGTVIEEGAVLVRAGKIAEVYGAPAADPKRLDAEIVDASGKTLLPGLIDMHVHLGAAGGVYANSSKYADPKAAERRLAAYLYSGVTAVRSTGDWLNQVTTLRKEIDSGDYLGSQVFTCGPLFTAEGGHPTELLKMLPENLRKEGEEQFIRLPKTADQARSQVDALAGAHVDCIKTVLESGNAGWGLFNRLDRGIYNAIVVEAKKNNLPSATHTGSSADMKDAVHAHTNSIEHGSMVDDVPDAMFAEMKVDSIAYDPTLSVFEAMADMLSGNADVLNESLLQQVGPQDLIEATREMVSKQKPSERASFFKQGLARANRNLLNAYRSGVTLIVGSDAGNMLVIHGPTVQHEMELWVKAGIPPTVALQSATYNAAKWLHADDRIGFIQKGRDATLLLVDGDPLRNIADTEHINYVMFRGEQINRPDLLNQDKE